MIRLKDDTINPRGLSTQALLGIIITQGVLAKYDSDLVITSLNDGVHSLHSDHYRGDAWDVRVWYIEKQQMEVVAKLRKALNKHYFILEERDHIHIAYKPEKGND